MSIYKKCCNIQRLSGPTFVKTELRNLITLATLDSIVRVMLNRFSTDPKIVFLNLQVYSISFNFQVLGCYSLSPLCKVLYKDHKGCHAPRNELGIKLGETVTAKLRTM